MELPWKQWKLLSEREGLPGHQLAHWSKGESVGIRSEQTLCSDVSSATSSPRRLGSSLGLLFDY